MTTAINPRTLFGKAISRGKSPRVPAGLYVPLPFASDTTFTLSMQVSSQVANNTGIEGIQSVYIDNSKNSQPLDLTFDSGQNITAPPFAQAVYPVFFSGEMLNFSTTCTGGLPASLLFINTREQAQQWSTKVPIVNASGSTVVTFPGNVALYTDASAALTAGGTPQLLISANPARINMFGRNPATDTSQGIAAPEPVYLGLSDPAVSVGKLGSYELMPGDTFPDFLIQSQEAIYWVAATTGHRFTFKWC